MAMTTKRPLAIALRGLIGGALLALTVSAQGSAQGPGGPGEGPRASLVETDRVRTTSVEETTPIIGRVVTRQESIIAARVAGPIAEVLVEVGDKVRAGDPVAQIVPDTFEWERRLAEAEYEEAAAAAKRAEAELGIARAELRRIEGLRNSAAFQQSRFEDKALEVATLESALNGAKARERSAQAKLELAALDYDYATIRAPFSGIVTVRHVSAGEFLSVSSPVVTLINDLALEVEADIPAANLAGVAKGRTMTALTADGSAFDVTVRAVLPTENPLTRTRTVRFDIADEAYTRMRDGDLVANQSLTLRVPAGASGNALTVSKDAVIREDDTDIVFVIEDGQAHRRTPTLGRAIGSRFEVIDGLNDGDVVVVRGNEALEDGDPVRTGEAELGGP